MNIHRSSTVDGSCVLTFNRPESSANLFDRATLEELEQHVATLETESGIRGVILASAKPRIFIAGADLNVLAETSDERTLRDMVETGQRIFTRLARLPMPTVAAIHGVCVGGGLEVALACDWRVASNDKVTKLGLPETQLGILPAWGGSTRLPRLVGLPAALGLILTGRQVVGAQARKLGLVDDVTHPEQLLDAARDLIARGKRTRAPRRWTDVAPASWLVAAKARRDVRAKTRGHYPAPLRAIDVCTAAASGPIEAGFARERDAFLQLARTPECRNLLRLFFLQERAKKLQLARAGRTTEGQTSSALQRVAVIGAGTMGAGIAQWTSARGLSVYLKDVSPEALARGLRTIEKLFSDGVKRRVFTPPEATADLDRITLLHTNVPMTNVDLVIEAALEKLDVKQQVFRELESLVGPDTVLATNTSALSIDAIAAVLARPDRVVGLHFFNPVHRMQLVEIVRGPRTSAATLETALQFTKAIGKLPVVVKDSPGFLVNRILLPYMVEAVRMFSEGVPAAVVDRTMLDFGMPMGPIRLGDEVGLDVAQHVAKDLERRLESAVPIGDTLEKMIAKGWLGKKSGRGFYVYGGRREQPAPAADVRFLQTAPVSRSDGERRRDRLVLIMVNEAARVLAEGIVDAPEDVDFGMIMGTGWAPFRGGPLRHADARGVANIVQRLDELAREVAPHFAPCARLRDMAREGRTFYGDRPAREAHPRGPAEEAEPRHMTPAPA